MALYTTEDVGNVSFQQPVQAPQQAPSSTSGAGIGAVADIVSALAPGIQRALNDKNPLDDFAGDLESDLKSVPTTAKGAAQRERKIKQRWLDFSTQHPELADDAAAYTRNVTGYDLTTPDAAVAVNNQMKEFYVANPSMNLETMVMGDNGQIDEEATFNRREEVYYREMERASKRKARAAELARLEENNEIRKERATAVAAELSVGWSEKANKRLMALETFASQAEGPEQALAEIRQVKEQSLADFRIEADDAGLRPEEYSADIDRIAGRFDGVIEKIEGNLGDYPLIARASEAAAKLRFGEAITPILGDIANTEEIRKAFAQIVVEQNKTDLLKAMKGAATVDLARDAELNGFGRTERIGVPDEEDLTEYRNNFSDLSPEGQRTVTGADGNAVEKPKTNDIIKLNSDVLGRVDINAPSGPASARQAAIVITNTVGAVEKPLTQKSLETIFNDKALENLNRASQLNDVASQETVESMTNMAENQMTLAVGAAESRLGNLPRGLGITYKDGKFSIEATGTFTGTGPSSSMAPKEFVFLRDGQLYTMDNLPSGSGGTQIEVESPRFAVAEFNRAKESLKAANYLSKRMERITGVKDEWRGGVDQSFERFAPKAPETTAMPENIKLNEAMQPLVNSLDGASELTRPYAASRMNAVLSGPFQQLQETFDSTLTINDAIAKDGTSREKNTPGSRHFHGDALDIDVSGMSDAEKLKLVDAALKAGFQGFGFGNNILHVDMGKPRAWNYNNETFGGRPVGELIEGVRSGVRALPDLPMIDTGQAPTDEEEMGMEADPREGRPTNFIEFAIPNGVSGGSSQREENRSVTPINQPSASPSGGSGGRRDTRNVQPINQGEEPTPRDKEDEPRQELSEQATEQKRVRAMQRLERLGIDVDEIPVFETMEEVQQAIREGTLRDGQFYEIDGTLEIARGL